ncbi:hypothetical protein JHK82_044706 [Glycine max]|uniref:Uncharacterized protein n=1 Tax=Glycine soja TaxID=3848 RepID=A0A445EXS6_GLYSO|nr:hypothetical protein JHK82_044706 [Glycine max]RZB41143.1 hypothetical protein D0Y65_055446 [Glycine soja]
MSYSKTIIYKTALECNYEKQLKTPTAVGSHVSGSERLLESQSHSFSFVQTLAQTVFSSIVPLSLLGFGAGTAVRLLLHHPFSLLHCSELDPSKAKPLGIVSSFTIFVARCLLRSAASRAASAANLAAEARLRPARYPFQLPKQTSISNHIFRLSIEASFCVELMLPYHGATAFALLNSMLLVSRHS